MEYYFSLISICSVNNRLIKDMIIDLLGDSICFSYPRVRKKSQMFFSSKIKTIDIGESLKECANVLRTECEEFDFCLDESFNLAEDATLSLKYYLKDCPPTWSAFFDSMFPYQSKSENIIRKCDTIFQIIYYLVHNGKKKTPFHLSLCESIHDTCRSKELITIMNILDLCMSYDELDRIDIGLATQSIESARENRVPVPENIENSIVIHGAMDNFDNEESTQSGIGSSHDTILMFFQNTHDSVEDPYLEKSNNQVKHYPIKDYLSTF